MDGGRVSGPASMPATGQAPHQQRSGGSFPVGVPQPNPRDDMRMARRPEYGNPSQPPADVSRTTGITAAAPGSPAEAPIAEANPEASDAGATPEEPANETDATLTVALVQEAIAAVEASESYDEATRAEHLKFLQQAVKWLESGDEAQKRAAQLQAEIDGVPDKLAELEAKLAEAPLPAVPQYQQDATISQLEQALSQVETELESAKAKLTEHDKLAESQGPRIAKLNCRG